MNGSPVIDDTILFVGLGRMGGPVALRLAQAGFDIHIYDVDRAVVGQLAARGLIEAPADRLAHLRYRRTLLCLPDPGVVAGFLEGRSLERDAGYSRTVADFTTVAPSFAGHMQRVLIDQGVDYLDVPLSGGEAGAASGKLVVMASGSRAGFAQVEPALRVAGNIVHYLGEIGAASRMKAINQFVYLAYNACFAAGLSMAKTAGLPEAVTLDVLRNGAPRHPLIEDRLDKVLASGGKEGFAIWRCLKDLNCLEDVQPSGLPGSLLDAIKLALEEAKADGLGSHDILAIGALPDM
ncbi:NAD(P)-dependent oxidoreductase [Roseiarcaceae bacterium H3SJ34-1]|uniref:NAD(P)-dependent oxidoreductase n=1 Tax=Terripilifer ovatus TaxID=3032367 RepID=UPI003AB98896|nr:NAD(P)-dependent oxidoreductase [Roseiarcaceae bacterium H3SJ34-1]